MRCRYFLAAAVLLCIGCGRPTFEDSSDIWSAVTNKPKSQVRSILGRPDSVMPTNRYGYGDAWLYKGIILDKASGRRQGAVINFKGDIALNVDAF
jgi:hypothetical protein